MIKVYLMRAFLYVFTTFSLKKILPCIICVIVLLGAVFTPHAEIYRWQDQDGIIRYSNIPPEDKSLILDTIPTKRVPLVEDANGTVYYLNVPDGNLGKNIPAQEFLEQVTLPPEVLDELMQDASTQTAQTSTEASQPQNLTVLTVRLAELEGALEREITNRLKWEQEYLKTQSHAKELEQQNTTLKVALAQMEGRIDKLQKTVDLSEIHVSALRDPQQQLGAIEGKVNQIQVHVDDVAQQTKQRTASVQTELDTIKDTQQQTVDSVYARVASLASSVERLQESTLAEDISTNSQKLQELETRIPTAYDDSHIQTNLSELKKTQTQEIQKLYARLTTVDDIKTSHSQQIDALHAKLNTLETGVKQLQDLAISEKLASLSTEVSELEGQRSPAYDDSGIHSRLKDLETTQQNQVQGLTARLDAYEGIKTAHTQQLAILSQKIDTIESKVTDLNSSKQKTMQADQIHGLSERLDTFKGIKTAYDRQLQNLTQKIDTIESKVNSQDYSEQVSTLSTKIDTLENQQQQTPDYDVRVKLAALATDVENLVEALPSSQRASEVVAELRENGNALKNIVVYQAQQLEEQQKQMLLLQKEIEILKTQTSASFPQNPSEEVSSLQIAAQIASREDSPGVQEFIEKNTFLEAVIKHQANALNIQKERINNLETKLNSLQQQPQDINGESVDDEIFSPQRKTSGRILIVPRRERRTDSRFSLLKLLNNPF